MISATGEAVLAFVKEHPGCTSSEVEAAVPNASAALSNLFGRMLVNREIQDGVYCYTLDCPPNFAREAVLIWESTRS